MLSPRREMELSPHLPFKLEDYGHFHRQNEKLDLNLYLPRFHMSHLLSVKSKRTISLTFLCIYYTQKQVNTFFHFFYDFFQKN